MENNDNKTVEKDELTGDKLLSGHEYDNIRELDNRLPLWWVWLFIITIVFAVAYIFVYDVIKVAPYQQEEYKNEIAEAGTMLPGQPAMPASANLIALTDQPSLEAGKAIWEKSCKVCHLDLGQGLVGPNLCDTFSIHGCRFPDIVNIITVGAPEKGMISWKTQLTGDQIMKVASFVKTLQGTNPPNPKAPQGEPCKKDTIE
jgi:cytochrome c oxidase cbb3-type subunit III